MPHLARACGLRPGSPQDSRYLILTFPRSSEHATVKTTISLALSTLVAATFVANTHAQTDRTLPTGLLTIEGNSNNTIPFWATSGTYQQVHDAADMLAMNNGAPIIMNAIGFRKDASTTVTAARTWDVQFTVGITPLNSTTAGTDFATNLGPTPTIVVPYTSINIPSLTPISTPNPVGFSVPFTAPFPFPASPTNNFCWEMRHRNASSAANMAMDVQSGTSVTSALVGTGCTVTGQALPASITTRSWALATGVYRNVMTRAPATTPATFFLGVQPMQITLPGLCGTLEFLPLANISGVTDAAGALDVTINAGRSFVGTPSVSLYGQFVFADATLPLGLGLSDASRLTSPIPALSARFYTAPSGGGAGNETATTATGSTRSYGLVTIFSTL